MSTTIRKWLVRAGLVRSVVILTLLAILISLGLTTLVLTLGGDEINLTAVIAATVIPAVTAGLFGTLFLRLVYALEAAEQRFRELATLDELTGIKNRRFFLEIAERDLAIARRYDVEFAILIFDLDDFKRINDRHGHIVGDRVLQAVAQTCSQEIRKSDVLARLGGDEFVILISQSTYIDTGRYMARLREKIEGIKLDDGPEVNVSASMGVARYTPEIESLDMMMSQADRAMYASKENAQPRSEQ